MTEEYTDLITGKPLEPWAKQAMETRAAPTETRPALAEERALLAIGNLRNSLDNALGNARATAASDFKTEQHQGRRGEDWDNGFIAAWLVVEAEGEKARAALTSPAPAEGFRCGARERHELRQAMQSDDRPTPTDKA